MHSGLLLVWFLFGAFLIYWLLQVRALSWSPNTLATSVQTVAMDSVVQDKSSNSALSPMAYVMGADATESEKVEDLTPAPAALNVQLLGVLLNGTGGRGVGVVLMAVDGQAARVFRLGQEVMPGWQLVRINAKEVTLRQPRAAAGEQVLALAQPSPDKPPALPIPPQVPDGMLQPSLNPTLPDNTEGRPVAPARFTPKQP